MRNLEFKVRVTDARAAQSRALALGADLWGDLRQTDTYFAVAHGRLKLRETAGFPAELVYYERDEDAATRPSDYEKVATPDGAAMLALLAKSLGVLAVVRKRRTLLLVDTTRVHLDNVDGLGSFLELEVPVKDDEATAAARLASLVHGLGFDAADGIRASYLDLTLAARAEGAMEHGPE